MRSRAIYKRKLCSIHKTENIYIERLLIVKNELEASEIDLKEFMERNRGYERSPELFMKYSQLLRQVKLKKEVYLTLQKAQLELVRIEEVKTSPILHILDSAVPPIKKSYPNRRLFLIISFLFGTIFSSLIVVLEIKNLEKIKICVVGAGDWGENHIKTLFSLKVYVGCVDIDNKKLEKNKKKNLQMLST